MEKQPSDGSNKPEESSVQVAFNSSSLEINETTAIQEASKEESKEIDEISTLQETNKDKELAISLKTAIDPIPLEEDVVKRFETLFTAIEDAFPENKKIKEYAFPHPRNWIGPRFMAIWALPIVILKRLIDIFISSNPVRPYEERNYSIKKTETVYTSAKEAFNGNKPIRFFGPRFMAIWVLPLGITGILMEFLFVSPLKGTSPFG